MFRKISKSHGDSLFAPFPNFTVEVSLIYLDIKIHHVKVDDKIQVRIQIKSDKTVRVEMTQLTKADRVDAVLEQWKQERPDLDVEPMGIIGRISRAERLIEERINAVCSEFQLERWGFDVLATLRRAGKPYELAPTQLFRSLLRTSGTMTNRIDRLEAAGLVERRPDRVDRRAIKVALTKRGLKLIDRAVAAHMKVEGAMIASFSADDRARFAGLLRVLLQYLEA